MAKGIAVHGERLRRIRESRMMSQGRLGKEARVATPTISRLENGHPGTYDTIERLAKALNVDAGLLLEVPPEEVLATEKTANGAVEAVELSDAAGTAHMDRIEAGEVEELLEDEERYFGFLHKAAAKPDSEDLAWTVRAYERDLARGLAALSKRDREEGAEAIWRVLRRIREGFWVSGGKG